MAQSSGDFKRSTQRDLDIALLAAVHENSEFDAAEFPDVDPREILIALTQSLIDEIYPELTHQRLAIDGDREALADAITEGTA